MKKLLLTLIVSLVSCSSFASDESYATASELPAGSVIEAMIDIATTKPVCPKGYLVAKKHCWDSDSFRFRHCGYFCSKTPAPPRGGQH